MVAIALSLQHGSALPPGWTDDHPFTHLVQNLGHDARSLARPATLGVLGAGALAAGIVRPSDHSVARWVDEAGASKSYTPIGGLIGNEWLQASAAVATYTIGVVQKSPEVAHIGSDLIRAQLLNGVMTTTIKLAADRERPSGGNYSFPSGHTSSTFASATVLADHYGWKVGVPAYGVAGFVGWTRIRDRSHWMSDVVFGSAVGIAAGRAVTFGHRPSSWSIAPAAMPGGAAIVAIYH